MAEPTPPDAPDSPAPSAPAAPAASPWKGRIILLIKVGLAAGLLYWVLSTRLNESAQNDLREIFVNSRVNLILALTAFSIQLFIGAQRLRLLQEPHGLRIGYFHALRLTYLGAFFDTFMVTSVGGDAVKAIYIAREAPPGRKVEAVSVLVLDRLLGLLGLLSLMIFMILLHVRELWADDDTRKILPYLFIGPGGLLVGTLLLLSRRAYNHHFMQWFIRILPMSPFLDRAYKSMQAYRERLGLVVACWGLSLIVHLCGVISGYLLLTSMHRTAEFGSFLVAWFICTFCSSFLPFGGIGTGQPLWDFVFMKIANVPNGWVLCTAFQAVVLIAKLPGMVAWLASREHAPAGSVNVTTTEGVK
jgi:glycosyltransferase 2 family protein